jgi:hopanoid biosynthesis associated protein HpnK
MLRRLVINADDLGLTPGVNRGIFDAARGGVLTSASLMAIAPATDEAIAGLRDHPGLGIGCHLMLVDGLSALPAHEIPTLADREGRFRRSWKPFIAACLARRVSMDDVERELTAQIERLRSAGVTLTHLDSHKHVHAYPPIFAIVIALARRFGIGAVRVPFERRTAAVGGNLRTRAAGWRQAAQNFALGRWARIDQRAAAAAGISTPAFIGRVHTGMLDEAALESMLRGVAPGVTELMVHPGDPDAALQHVRTRLRASRADELKLLCAPATARLIEREGLHLVRHDLQPRPARSFSSAESDRRVS